MTSAQKPPESDQSLHGVSLDILASFRQSLLSRKLNKVTAKNYVSDVRKFLAWSEVSTLSHLGSLSTDSYFANLTKCNIPASTTSRYLASVRRFATFLQEAYGLKLALPTINAPTTNNSQPKQTGVSSAQLLSNFKSSLQKENKSISTVKNYLSDVNHFITWSASNGLFTTKDINTLLSTNTLNDYKNYLNISQTSSALLQRRESAIKKLTAFAATTKLITANPFAHQVTLSKLSPLAWFTRNTRVSPSTNSSHLNSKYGALAKIYKSYHALPFTPYLHLAILVLFTTAFGIFGYNQIIKQANLASAYPSAPNRPTRQLSFQGRLTDSSDTPIYSPTSATFKLYNSAGTGIPVSGGTQLYTTGSCTVNPDQNGIFNVILGAGSCGSEIPSSVFSENVGVWLEVTIAAETLSPRQAIATVAYALNSETLQGFPIDATGSATRSTVVTMNGSGDIVLGEQSQSIKATSGTFGLSGNTLTLSTNATTNGNITLAPDGTGQIQALGGTTTTDFFRIQNANQTSGTLISGYVGNNNTTGNLLTLSSGSVETDRFTVSTTGQTTIDAAALGKSAVIVNQLSSGDIFSASASGVNRFLITNAGNVGIGTTNPGVYLLNVNGKAYAATQGSATGEVLTAGRIINTTAPLTGGTSLTQDITIACPTCITTATFNWVFAASSGTPHNISVGGTASVLAGLNITTTASGTGNITVATVTNPVFSTSTTTPLVIGGTGATSSLTLMSTSGTGAGSDFISFKLGNNGALESMRLLGNGNIGIGLTGTGFVGIGTTVPGAKLTVVGAGTSTGFALRIQALGGLDRFTVIDNGNVGIGLTNPAYKLEINGTLGVGASARFSGNVGIGGTATAYPLTVIGNIMATSQGTAPNQVITAGRLINTTAPLTGGTSLTQDITIACPTCLTTANNNWVLSASSGPAQTMFSGSTALFTQGLNILTTASSANTVTIATVTNPVFGTSVTTPLLIGGTAAASSITLQATAGTGAGSEFISFKIGNNGAQETMRLLGNGNVGIGLTGTGYVGIGTTLPGAKLHLLSSGTGTNFAFRVQAFGGLDRLVIQDNGNIGIGTTSATALLDLVSSATTGIAQKITANSLTTGNALNISSTSNTLTSGNLANVSQTATYLVDTNLSGSLLALARNITNNGAASGNIIIDTITSGTAISSNSLTISHTTNSGTSKLLIVTIGSYRNTNALYASGVTYNGAAMTLLARENRGGGLLTYNASEIYYLKNPPNGTYDVVVSYGSTPDFISAGATSMTSVDQSTTFGTAVCANGTGGNPSVGVTSAVGEIVIDIAGKSNSDPLTAGTGQTVRWQKSQSSTYSAHGTSTKAGATNVTMSWSAGATTFSWTQCAVSVKPDITSPTNTYIANALASFSSTCSVIAGNCDDQQNILKLNQAYPLSTGSVLSIAGSGLGNLATISGTNTAANGVHINVSSNSNNLYGLMVTGNNGSNTGLYVSSAGNVGIGTTNPLHKLDVQGGIYALTQGTAPGQVLTAGRLINTTSPLTGGSSLTGDLTIACPTCVTTGSTAWVMTATSGTAQPIGIGQTATFAAGLNIVTTAGATRTVTFDTVSNPVFSTSTTTPIIIGGTGPASNLTFMTTSGTGAGSDFISFKLGNNGALESMRLLGNGNIGIGLTGNVGIGTTNPIQKLSVIGTAHVSSTLSTNGWLGIGTTSPQQELQIVDSDPMILLGSSAWGNQWGLLTVSMSSFGLNKSFNIRSMENNRTDFTILDSGYVGIGNSNPLAKLDVTGDIYLTSGLSTHRTAVSDGTIEATKFCTGDGETNCVTDFSAVGTNYWQRNGTNLAPLAIGDNVGIGITTPLYKLHVAGSFKATQTITSYDNLVTVDRNGGGDYTTIGAAITAINGFADASSSNPYTIQVMNGTYDEDVTLPAWVSIKGQSWDSTIIDGRVTASDNTHIEDLRIYPTGGETIALQSNATAAGVVYVSNAYIVINNDTNAPTYLVVHNPTSSGGDLRIYNSFLYGRNPNAGGSAATYLVRNIGTAAGDVEVQGVHLKSSCGNNNNCVLALNDASASDSDIIITGSSWSAFNDTSAVGAINNNASGQIKLQIAYENDLADNSQYTTSGTGIIISPVKTGSIALDLNEGFTSGTAFNLSFMNATTLAGSLNGIDMNLNTNVTDGNYQVKGINLNLPDSGTALSYGLFVSGEDANYFSGNVGIGTTNPSSFKLEVAGNIGPSANDTYDLGSDSLRFKDLYLGGETIHLGTAAADEGELSYFTANNVLGLQSDGNLALQATSGNVGIGTTNPLYKLDVQGGIYALTQGTAPGQVLTAGRLINTTSPLTGGSSLTGDLTIACPTCITTASFNWVLNGTSGTPQDIGVGQTALFAAGSNITTTASATDTLTIATVNNPIFSASVSSPIFQGNGTAVTFGNVGIGTTVTGSVLSVVPTSWTATPTISGLITATSGLTANGTATFNSNSYFPGSGVWNTSGNVGIGKTNPLAKLAIVGAGTGPGFTFQTHDSLGTDMFTILDNGNVGIGTTNPQYELSVYSGNVWVSEADGSSSAILLNPSNFGGIIDLYYSNNLNSRIAGDSNVNSYFYANGSGNVGIGTSNPGSYKLNVVGKIYAGTQGSAVGEVLTAGRLINTTSPLTGGSSLTGDLTIACPTCVTTGSTAWVMTATSGTAQPIGIGQTGTFAAGTNMTTLAGATRTVTFSTVMNPVFSTSVTSPIQIGGTAAASSLTLQATSGTGVGSEFISFKIGNNGAQETMRLLGNGNIGIGLTGTGFVGIGTTVPGAKLTVVSAGTGTGLALRVQGLGGLDRFTVIDNGNVGIGLTNPAYKLEVNGTLGVGASARFTGNVGIGGTATAYPLTVVGKIFATTQGVATNEVLTAGRLINTTSPLTGGSSLTGDLTIACPTCITTASFNWVLNGTSGTPQDIGVGQTALFAAGLNMITTAGATDTLTIATVTNPVFGTSVTTPLVIGGTGVASTLSLQATSGTGNSSSFINFKVGNNGGTEAMRIDNNGNVGIGSTNPSTKLDIKGNLYVGNGTFNNSEGWNTVVDIQDTGAHSRLSIRNSTTEGRLLVHTSGWAGSPVNALVLYTVGTQALSLGTNNGVDMTIDSTGNVGIGTTNPKSKLNIASFNDGDGFDFYSPANNRLAIQSTLDNGALGNGGDNGYLLLQPMGGYVGIGTTTPSSKFHIEGTQSNPSLNFNATGIAQFSSGVTQLAISGQNASPWGISLQVRHATLDSYAYSLNLQPLGGAVGIGTTNPLAALDVTGDIYTTSGISTFRTAVSDGTVEATKFCTGDGETNCVSDLSSIQNWWQRNGTNLSPLNIGDNVGIGTTNPGAKLEIAGNVILNQSNGKEATSMMSGQRTFTNTSGTLYGNNVDIYSAGTGTQSLYSGAYFAYASANTTGTIGGSYASANTVAGATAITTLRGMVGNITSAVSGVTITTATNLEAIPSVSAGTITNLYGLRNRGDLITAGTISNRYGEYIGNPAGGTITNNYGLYIEDQTTGATDFAIYSTGGINYFGGNVGIGSTNPTYKLEIASGIANIINGYSEPTSETGFRLKLSDNGGINNDAGIGMSGSLGGESMWINNTPAGDIRFMFGTNGETVTFKPNGNVGIGNTAPRVSLEINRSFAQPLTSTINGGMILSAQPSSAVILDLGIYNAPANFSWLQSRHATTASATYNLVLQPLSGNVGIGNTNPGYTLDVNGTLNAGTVYQGGVAFDSLYLKVAGDTTKTSGKLFIGSTAFWVNAANGDATLHNITATDTASPGILVGNTSNGGYIKLGSATIGKSGTTTTPLLFDANGNASSPDMVITNSGNIGIATTNPQAWLQIGGDIAGASNGSLMLKASQYNSWTISALYEYTNADLIFNHSGTERMRMNANGQLCVGYNGAQGCTGNAGLLVNGNVGIGTSTPTGKLHVMVPSYSDWDNDAQHFIVGNTTDDDAGVRIAYNQAQNYGVINVLNPAAAWGNLILAQSGNVGIGTSNPTSKLYLLGSTASTIFTINDSTADLFTVNSVSSTFNNPTTFTSPGDVSIAYDINFTNPTSSYIKSAAPITIQSGETFNSSNLTLKTFNAGSLVINSTNIWADGNYVGIGTTSPFGLFQVGTAATNPGLFVSVSNKVGIGTTNPASGASPDPNRKLLVAGGITVTSGSMISYDDNYYVHGYSMIDDNLLKHSGFYGQKWFTASGEMMRLTQGGNFGIGTTNPGGLLAINSPSGTIPLRIHQNATDSSIPSLSYMSTSTGDIGQFAANTVNGTSTFLVLAASGRSLGLGANNSYVSPSMLIDSNGNVGIGTTNPATKLEVLAATTQLRLAYDTTKYSTVSTDSTGDLIMTAGVGNDIWFNKSDGISGAHIDLSSASSAGEVLDVSQTAVDGQVVTTYGTTITGQNFTTTGTGTGYLTRFQLSGKRVGTNSFSVTAEVYAQSSDIPTGYPLAVSDPVGIGSTAYSAVDFTFRNPTLLSASTKYAVVFKAGPGSDGSNYFQIESEWTSGSVYAGGKEIYSTNGGASWTSSADVDMKFYAYLTKRYGTLYIAKVDTINADLAENYPSTQTLLPGEIVSVDKNNNSHIVRSTESYDNHSIGIISTSPGLLMGSIEGDPTNNYPVALAGRVPVLFSRENGDVEIGDPITSSGTNPGYGMKATQAGIIVAKALESSTKCSNSPTCTVNVIITRQYAEPQTVVADNGEVIVLENEYTNPITSQNISSFSLKSSAGETITRVGAFAKSIVADLEAGSIVARQIATDSLTIQGVSLDTYIENKVTAMFDILKLEIRNSDFASPLANINTLNTQNLNTQNASISGTLYANEIDSPEIAKLKESLAEINSNYATASSILANIQAKYSSYGSLANPSPTDVLSTSDLDSTNATISGDLALSTSFDLYTQKAATFTDLSVSSSLLSNSLNSNEGDLFIQPTGTGMINLLAGIMILSPDGKVTINGDLLLSGTLYAGNITSLTGNFDTLTSQGATISGTLALKTTNPFEKLLSIYNEAGEIVGSIDASGSAKFNELATNKLVIATASSLDSTSSTTLASNATVGTSILPAGATSITINSRLVTDDTLIYITPVSSTNNQVIYVKAKATQNTSSVNTDGYFTVAIDSPLATDIKFNWWIIN